MKPSLKYSAMPLILSIASDAWKAPRFHHPAIATYIVDERYVYDAPDGVALEKWASETFQVIENKTADEVIASTATLCPYATVTYLP
jgi:hypothetical protein